MKAQNSNMETQKKLHVGAQQQLSDNVEYVLRDAQGNIKPIFQENKLFTFLMEKGIVSPHFFKIPFLLGNWSDRKVVANLKTNAGLAGMASRCNGSGGEAAFTYIAVGTGTNAASAGDTTLQTELATSGLSRANGSVSRVTTTQTNDTAQVTNTFTVTGTAAITESGVLNAASVGTLLARQVFSSVNVVNGDSFACTWKVQIS